MNSIKQSNTLPILLIIVLVGTFLRLHELDTYSIFFDEKSTMVVSQGIVLEGSNQKDVFTQPSFTPQDFWKPKTIEDYYDAMTRSDIGNSPFYYLLLHIWMDIFGLSDFSSRSLSVLFSILTIWLTYRFGRRFFSARTGLIAAGIVAIEPFFIAYGHQARNYSLTFFLALLSTYFLLKIVENENAGQKRNYGDYAGYIIASFLCPLSHFLTISVFLSQALYVIFFLRIKSWVPVLIAAIIAMSGLAWWLIDGGGKWTLYTLDYQAKEYKRVAETMPYDNPYGLVLPATLENVFNRSLPIFSDLYIFTNGMTETLIGKKNLILSLLTGIILILASRLSFFRRLSFPIRMAALGVIALLPVVIYTESKSQFFVFSVALYSFSLFPLVPQYASAIERRRLWLLYFMAFVPTLFLIVFSFKNGHTFGLTQRYSGFSFPYVIIFIALLLQRATKLPTEFKILLGIMILVQSVYISTRLQEYYQDRSAKYGYFVEPRPKNPYYEAAQYIKANYQPGDTIFYGAPRIVPFNEMGRTFLSHSVQDAQLTNLYLPKDAQYVQVLDTIQINKITLKVAATGDSLELADLSDKRF